MKLELSFGFIVFMIIAVSLVAFFGIFWAINSQDIYPSSYFVEISGKIINVDIADNPKKWYDGLSSREKLCENCGMLFIFPDKKERQFVMRNMNFPLDILWINDDQIVKIDRNLEPEGSDPQLKYESPGPVNYVLEVNGGYSDQYGISEGEKIHLK